MTTVSSIFHDIDDKHQEFATARQRMPSPPMHLIPHLSFRGPCCICFEFVFRFMNLLKMTDSCYRRFSFKKIMHIEYTYKGRDILYL